MPLLDVRQLEKKLADLLRADAAARAVTWVAEDIDLTGSNYKYPVGSVMVLRAVHTPWAGDSWRAVVKVALSLVSKKETQAAAEEELKSLLDDVHRVVLTNQDVSGTVLYVDSVETDFGTAPGTGTAWAQSNVTYENRSSP